MTVTATLLSGVLPAGAQALVAAEMYTDPPELVPLPEEEPLIAKSVAKRRNEFITVRYCAREALGELGVQPVPILKGEKGEPCWPDGIVGSLTHCEGYRGAVVAKNDKVRSVGIDAEPHDVLPKGVLDAISLPVERTELRVMPGGLYWDRILFCAKEATYKAWFPVTRRWLGFEDAHITFDVDGNGASGGFESRILIDPAAVSGPPLQTLSGRWSVRDGLALTAIVAVTDAGGQERSDPGSSWGLVIVDKPAGMTSHDVVGRCRRIFGTRKVGHAGTLDPMATGVLVVGIERATKILGLLTATDKSYAATIRLGQTTSTEDAEGEITQTVSAAGVGEEQVATAVTALRGEIDQVPSAVSAIKVDGQRAYKLAREGHVVELAPRRVRIGRFDVLDVRRRGDLLDVDVEVDCSSGTYIRALARDVGNALGVGGHLTALRRTSVGGFRAGPGAHARRPCRCYASAELQPRRGVPDVVSAPRSDRGRRLRTPATAGR